MSEEGIVGANIWALPKANFSAVSAGKRGVSDGFLIETQPYSGAERQNRLRCLAALSGTGFPPPSRAAYAAGIPVDRRSAVRPGPTGRSRCSRVCRS